MTECTGSVGFTAALLLLAAVPERLLIHSGGLVYVGGRRRDPPSCQMLAKRRCDGFPFIFFPITAAA